MMSDIKRAVCIPTYRRPEVIEEFIEKHMERYSRLQFDVFIYDSSEDTQTETIVKKWMPQYASLHLIRIDSSVHSNMKVYNIFREFGNAQNYDYLWVCGDAVSWSDNVLHEVEHCMHQGYDIIVPNHHDVEKLGTKEYTDKNQFFLDCAWQVTYYGTTILKVSTMLTDVDWDALIEKYAVPDSINLSHVAFYFEKINTMKHWHAIHLSFLESDIIVSPLKKASGWKQETFHVWCHCWPETINKLPREYKNKKAVIRKNGANSNILSHQNLKVLRSEGLLNREIYKYYKKKWHSLTTVPRLTIWFLSLVPQKAALDVKQYIRESLLKNRIKNFCARFEQVYIYGAGKKAKRYINYLDEMNIRFEACLVSELTENADQLDNHKIIVFSPSIVEGRDTGILLALNKKNASEVLRGNLRRIKYRKIFSEFIMWRKFL